MRNQREGFGLIEVIIAMLILTVGILAMGASTGYILNQVRASELRTDRMLAVRDAADRLHAMDWDDLENACASSVVETDRYTVTCDVTVTHNLARFELISAGPAFAQGKIVQDVTETTVIGIARPLQ